jgi:hypothetical protein
VSRRIFKTWTGKTWTELAAGARATGVLIVAVLAVACEQDAAKPRSFEYFKEDGLAREGALVRCNQDRDATAGDVECANARRAAVAVAAELEQARSGELAAESERKLASMRDRADRAERAQEDAELAAQAAADAAYEAQWRDPKAKPEAGAANGAAAPRFGTPLGPSMRNDTAYNVESLSQVPTRPELELAAVAPPVSEIARPEIEIEQAAIIPRPFRNDDGTVRR